MKEFTINKNVLWNLFQLGRIKIGQDGDSIYLSLSDYQKEYTPNEKGTPIETLSLSTRARNCLLETCDGRQDNIATVEHLTNCTKSDLLKRANLGAKTVAEIKNRLAEKGFSLKQ